MHYRPTSAPPSASRDRADRDVTRHDTMVRAVPGVAGQALTELTLILPMLALILLGAIDLGRAFHTEVAASSSARVGLLYAQQVASPRMLDCLPGTTCRFITVADVISHTLNEAQGGVNPSQMRVTVCLQHVPACPVSNLSEAVDSNEAITVTVAVPFSPITPFVHAVSIGGSVSGLTFPFEAIVPTATTGPTDTPTNTPAPTDTPTNTPTPTNTITPTNTPLPTGTPTGTATPTNTPTATTTPTPTATNTPAPTATPGGPTLTSTPVPTATSTPTAAPTSTPQLPTSVPSNTPIATPTPAPTYTPPPTDTPPAAPSPTLVPTPQISNVQAPVTGSGTSARATISWSANPAAANAIYYRVSGTTTWTRAAGTNGGTTGSNTIGESASGAWVIVSSGAYDYYVASTTTGGTATFPLAGASCAPSCPTFTLPP